MRWLFLFLLSLNLAYIAWQMYLPSGDSYTSVTPLKNVPPIVLLSELTPGQLEQDELLVSNQQEENADLAADKTAAEDARQVELAVVEQPVEKTVPQDVQAGMQHDTQQVAINTRSDTPVVTEVVSELVQQTDKTESCYTLGPFRDLDKLRGLTREIKSYVVATDFRGSEENEQALFWVYIQPEKSRSKAIETGKRLKANKIKDFYIIREGEKINGLSLGHFRNKNGAYGLAKRVKDLGFDVIVEPVYKTRTIYWLDYQLAAGVEIPQAILDKYIQSAKKDKINRLPRQCED